MLVTMTKQENKQTSNENNFVLFWKIVFEVGEIRMRVKWKIKVRTSR